MTKDIFSVRVAKNERRSRRVGGWGAERLIPVFHWLRIEGGRRSQSKFASINGIFPADKGVIFESRVGRGWCWQEIW